MSNADALVETLHAAALANGCGFRVDARETGKTIVYSARNIQIDSWGGRVSLSGDYDLRALLRLYRETSDEAVRSLLFDAAIPCCYCIDDKCTTMLMAKERTIEHDGRQKRLCGPYRHRLRMDVREDTLSACVDIVHMMLEHTLPHMHQDLTLTSNDVTYTLVDRDAFYLLGYAHKHSPISASDKEFAASLLRQDGTGRRRIGPLLDAAGLTEVTCYVGATDSFSNGVSYDFVFGILIDAKPAQIPEGAVCRKVRGGQWAVYNSSASDYRSIWRHYTERFYALEHQGYDSARIPFECYDEQGQFFDVHIPVDPDTPADSGMVWQVLHTPNELLAGFGNYAETDYPLYQDRPFDERQRIATLFPHAQCLARVSVHSLFGKPLWGFDGVPVDDLSIVPEDVERYVVQGGYWKRLGWKHFSGGYEAWGKALGIRAGSAVPLLELHHPRGFNQYVYDARGGYDEIAIPMRLLGKRHFEVVELAPQRVIGRLEAPPESVVTEADTQRFYTMPENAEQGTYVIGFTQAVVKMQAHGETGRFFDKPFVQGVLARPDTPVPDSLSAFTLDGGTYAKVTEDIPNGVLGWELGAIISDMPKETGHTHDETRQFIYKQCDHGRRYELYVPVHAECQAEGVEA